MPLWTEYELSHSGKDESRLDNPLDGLARREYAMPRYVSSSQNTMTSVYGEVDDSRLLDMVCGHGLIKIHCYTGIEKIPRSQQMLHMVPLQQMEGVLELRLKSESGCVKAELGVE